jgi:hypothetical protein
MLHPTLCHELTVWLNRWVPLTIFSNTILWLQHLQSMFMMCLNCFPLYCRVELIIRWRGGFMPVGAFKSERGDNEVCLCHCASVVTMVHVLHVLNNDLY